MTEAPHVSSHERRLPLWQVITTCAIVASAAASGGWYVARARIDDELREYERSKTWQLPALVRDLGVISHDLSAQISDKNELKRLRVETPRVKQELTHALDELNDVRAELKALQDRCSAYEASTFELAVGEAREIVPGELTIGLKDASAYSAEAKVQFQEQIVTIAPGQMLRARVGQLEYRVTLVKVHDRYPTDAATFKVNIADVGKP